MKLYVSASVLCFAAITLIAEPHQSSTNDKNDRTWHPPTTATFDNNEITAADAETSTTSPPNWYASSEWWLVIIAGLTGLTIAYQAREMARATVVMEGQLKEMQDASKQVSRQASILERSVAAAEKSADAAKDNIELFISRERSWIRIIEISPFSLPKDCVSNETLIMVEYKVMHFGPTDAIMTEALAKAIVTTSADIPQDSEDIWGTRIDPQIIKPSQPPIEESVPAESQGAEEVDGLKEGTRFIHFWGFFKYKDVFGMPRITKFRFLWSRARFQYGKSPNIVGYWTECGPQEDNSET